MEDTFYFLSIIDENNYAILQHVANHSDDSVYFGSWAYYGLPEPEYRKSHHLTNWVKENKPNWKIIEKQIPYDNLV